MIHKNASSTQASCSVNIGQVEFIHSLNNAHLLYSLVGNAVSLACPGERDFFISPDGNTERATAPLLMRPVDNNIPFTFTAKVKPDFMTHFDAGALYIYVDDQCWQKFAFESDDHQVPRIISVRTIGSSDDNKHDVIKQAAVYLKISSNTKVIGFYYSLDNNEWHMVRLYRNTYPQTIHLGISTQSPSGSGTSALFSEVSLTETAISDFKRGV